MSKKRSDIDILICEELINAIYQLRIILKIDDSNANFNINEIKHDFRKYYIHLVLVEVEKALLSILSNESFLTGDVEGEENDKYIQSKILESKIDEFSLWRRKFIEIFIDLIGFKKANEPIYYQHYILIHELARKNKQKEDRKHFWGCNSDFLNREIKDLKAQIDEISKSNNFNSKQWYIQNEKAYKGNITSIRFKKIFPNIKKHQKPFLLSYQNPFGKLSGFVHPKKQYNGEKSIKDYKCNLAGINVLAMYIIVEIKDLLRIRNVKDPLRSLARRVKNNKFPSKIFKLRTNPSYKKGEFVKTPEGPAKIVKIVKKKDYYKTFHVKYLGQSIEACEEYVGDEIQLLANNEQIKKIRKKVLDILKENNTKASYFKISKAIEDMVKESYEKGLII